MRSLFSFSNRRLRKEKATFAVRSPLPAIPLARCLVPTCQAVFPLSSRLFCWRHYEPFVRGYVAQLDNSDDPTQPGVPAMLPAL